MRNLARAHQLAYRTIHRAIPAPLVSFAHNAPIVQPCRMTAWQDRSAAGFRDFVLNRLFFRLIGPASLDFVAINYYTRMVVRSQGNVANRVFGAVCREHAHAGTGPDEQDRLGMLSARFGRDPARFARLGLPLLITENGIATDDEDASNTLY